MLKWIGRLALTLLALIVVAVAALVIRFEGWRAGLKRQLAQDSSVVETSLGPIEYAATGDGRSVLFLHGTPGGYDELLNQLKAAPNENDGLHFIIPSRPGYLRTPLSVGKTPAEQADAMIALLDRLEVGKVAVIAHSGGGPSAVQFALRHPDRCSALVLESALIRSQDGLSEGLPKSALAIWFRDFEIYFLWAGAPHARIPAANPDDSRIGAIAQAALAASANYDPRRAGAENDAAQESHLDGWPLDQITCPTLIIQGADDVNVPPSDAEYAHAQIPGAELEMFPGQDHALSLMRHKEVAERIARFLAGHP
jgi:pimeloyl-ACP methyl ester carboxylesterase